MNNVPNENVYEIVPVIMHNRPQWGDGFTYLEAGLPEPSVLAAVGDLRAPYPLRPATNDYHFQIHHKIMALLLTTRPSFRAGDS